MMEAVPQTPSNAPVSRSGPQDTSPPQRISRLLLAFVVGGLLLSIFGLISETYWQTLNRYQQSGLLSKTVGRKKLLWDLRQTNAAQALGKSQSVIDVGGDPEWLWDGPYDLDILLPDGRELKTDSLHISARIEAGEIKSMSINSGTELSAMEMREKLLAEVRQMRPNRRMDGADGEEAIARWYANLSKPDSRTLIWVVRGKPELSAGVSGSVWSGYIVQYELSWY